MMTPEEKEVEKINAAYHQALVELGYQVSAELLSEWAAVTLGNAASLGKYVAAASAIILTYRRRARQLSVAHSALERALLTGAALGDAEYPPSGSTLGALRSDFQGVLTEWSIERPLRAKAIPDSLAIDIEELPELEARIEERWELVEQELQDTFDILLGDKLNKKIEAVNAKPSEKLAEAEEKLDLNMASVITSAGERIALNGARQQDADIISIDRKVWGWVRIHDERENDHPCGFCSMLLTRGFVNDVIYSSKESAGGRSDGERYHTNCHCVAQKIYRSEQLKSPVYDEHRKLASEWESFTDQYGRSGPDVMKAWDKHIRTKKNVAKANRAASDDSKAFQADAA